MEQSKRPETESESPSSVSSVEGIARECAEKIVDDLFGGGDVLTSSKDGIQANSSMSARFVLSLITPIITTVLTGRDLPFAPSGYATVGRLLADGNPKLAVDITGAMNSAYAQGVKSAASEQVPLSDGPFAIEALTERIWTLTSDRDGWSRVTLNAILSDFCRSVITSSEPWRLGVEGADREVDKRLAAIKERRAKITGGWYVDKYTISGILYRVYDKAHQGVCRLTGGGEFPDKPHADFIANAPSDIDFLLELITRSTSPAVAEGEVFDFVREVADEGCLRGRQVHCVEREPDSADWCVVCKAKYLFMKGRPVKRTCDTCELSVFMDCPEGCNVGFCQSHYIAHMEGHHGHKMHITLAPAPPVDVSENEVK